MTNNIDKIRAFVDLMRNHAIAVAYGRQLYAADSALAELEKAAAPQFVAGEVDQRTLKNIYHRALNRIIEISEISGSNATAAEQACEWIAAVRSELGPALGLVEIREPSDDECRAIWREAKANEGDGSKVCAGRAMFDACRAVLWPKEGL